MVQIALPKLPKLRTSGAGPKTKKSQTRTEWKEYRSFQLQKKIKPQTNAVPGSFRLFGAALGILKTNAKFFAGIVAVYGVFSLLLVQGLTAWQGLDEQKAVLQETASDSWWGSLSVGGALFTQVLGGSSGLGEAARMYQFCITIIASLALIWGLRQAYAKHASRIRDSFYLGMYPLVPFLLVLVVIIVQLVPVALGGGLLDLVLRNDIAATTVELVLWISGLFVLAVVSLYLITSSLLALYVVSLPNMTPLHALRSARTLVRYRRWLVMRRILFLPFALLVLAAVILIPLIMFATPVVGWAFFVISLVALAVGHSYMYALYRSLL